MYSLLMPYLDNIDLVHFYKLSKLSKAVLTPQIRLFPCAAPVSKCIRFDVLFKMQNRDLPDEAFKLLPKQRHFRDVMRIVLWYSGKLHK